MDIFLKGEPIKIDLPDGNWVEVKEDLDDDQLDYLFQLEAKQKPLAELEMALTKWSYQLPLTKESIAKIRFKYRLFILSKLDEIYFRNEWTKNS